MPDEPRPRPTHCPLPDVPGPSSSGPENQDARTIVQMITMFVRGRPMAFVVFAMLAAAGMPGLATLGTGVKVSTQVEELEQQLLSEIDGIEAELSDVRASIAAHEQTLLRFAELSRSVLSHEASLAGLEARVEGVGTRVSNVEEALRDG